MTIHVRSPHDGQPVKVREEDVGRAVRDAQGRVLYVVPASDGQGHYGSVTRNGSERDEQRAHEWEANPPTPIADPTTATKDAPPQHIHDATGKPRAASWRGRLVIVALGVLVLFLIWLFGFGPMANRWTPSPAPPLEEKLQEQEQERTTEQQNNALLHPLHDAAPSLGLASPLSSHSILT